MPPEENIGIPDLKNYNNPTNRVQFEEDANQLTYMAKTSKVSRFVIKYSQGYVKSETGVFYVVLGFFIISTAISLFLVFGLGNIRTGDIPDVFIDRPYLLK